MLTCFPPKRIAPNWPELSFCTIEKYLNMTASGISADVVTCWYTDSNFKRLETTGTTWALQDLLNKEIPGFTLPENFIRWCGNFQGDVYAYPHTGTILSEDTSIKSAAAMIVARTFWKRFTGIVSSPCPKRIAWNS